jgi:WD40 repeat protein
MRVLLPSLADMDSEVQALAFSPDGRYLAASQGFREGLGATRSEVKIWDLFSEGPCEIFHKHNRFCRALAWSPDGTLLAMVGAEAEVFQRSTGKRVFFLQGQLERFFAVAFSPDNKEVIASTATGFINSVSGLAGIGNLATGKSRRARLPRCRGIWSLAYSPDGQTIAVGSEAVYLLYRDRPDPFTLRHNDKVRALAFSRDSRILAAAARNTITLWNLANREEFAHLQGHRDVVTCLAFTPSMEHLVSGGKDGTFRFWDLANFTEKNCLDWEMDQVNALALSPNGMNAAVGGKGQNLLVLLDLLFS